MQIHASFLANGRDLRMAALARRILAQRDFRPADAAATRSFIMDG
jgi:hypothetical protein